MRKTLAISMMLDVLMLLGSAIYYVVHTGPIYDLFFR